MNKQDIEQWLRDNGYLVKDGGIITEVLEKFVSDNSDCFGIERLTDEVYRLHRIIEQLSMAAPESNNE